MKGFLFTFGALLTRPCTWPMEFMVRGTARAMLTIIRDSLVKSIQDFGRVYMKNFIKAKKRKGF